MSQAMLQKSRVAHENTDDAFLVEALREGCDAAFSVLARRHRPLVERVVARVLDDPKNREEAVQDALLNIYRKIDHFRGESAFTTWIFRIAHNAALMRRRRDMGRKLLPLVEADGTENTAWGPRLHAAPRSTDADLMGREARGVIERAVERLDEKYRRVFLLREIEGYSTQKTAELMGLGVPAVKSRLRRARLSLRRSLEGYFGP